MSQLFYRYKQRIMEYLDEDLGYGDITSVTLIPRSQKAQGSLYFRESGVVSGLVEAATVFQLLGCTVELCSRDGDYVTEHQVLLKVKGLARALLSGERLALNIIGRMAGIATQTHSIVEAVEAENPSTRVAATRKTLPGFREFDKRAVIHGGGDPHRFRLDDCVLIKDNHLELVPNISDAIERVRESVSFTKRVEIEVRSLESAIEAAEAGADIIMFDNVSPEDTQKWLDELSELSLRDGIIYESSGGITLENAGSYAVAGVDVISVGALTHNVRSLDVKFEMEMV